MDKIVLKVNKRDISTPARDVRAKGLIPGVCYGADNDNLHLQMDYQEFRKVYNEAGENVIVSLDVDGEVHNVLIHDVQLEPKHNTVNHVDFIILNMKEKVDASVPVVVVGESAAVRELGGTVNLAVTEIAVRCLPANIPSEIEADISSINDFIDVVKLEDLKIPADVEVLMEEDSTIVTVNAPVVIEEDEVDPEEAEQAAIAASDEGDGDSSESTTEEASTDN